MALMAAKIKIFIKFLNFYVSCEYLLMQGFLALSQYFPNCDITSCPIYDIVKYVQYGLKVFSAFMMVYPEINWPTDNHSNTLITYPWASFWAFDLVLSYQAYVLFFVAASISWRKFAVAHPVLDEIFSSNAKFDSKTAFEMSFLCFARCWSVVPFHLRRGLDSRYEIHRGYHQHG